MTTFKKTPGVTGSVTNMTSLMILLLWAGEYLTIVNMIHFMMLILQYILYFCMRFMHYRKCFSLSNLQLMTITLFHSLSLSFSKSIAVLYFKLLGPYNNNHYTYYIIMNYNYYVTLQSCWPPKLSTSYDIQLFPLST